MGITRCADRTVARWLERSDEDWRHLAARGPRDFEKHARLRFIPDPSFPGQSEGDVRRAPGALSDNEQLGVTLAELTPYTATPDDCYFCIWEGWPSFSGDDPMPKISIPNRAYFLFRGSLADVADWDSQVSELLQDTVAPTPAFVWPANAWCVTCDVDPHFATIGASADAIARLVADTRVDVVVDDPDTEPPYYG
ncbi:hypothetical protein GS433_24390 [Rhodococcus hoagii]|uniref:hypothetical protein n=1 Tax=Rhodococcus hoagii TaxID=43767 RepID=UPI0007CD7236|nr:hypothetical protein [Prescottella equi]MBM4537428.1 hypothetical protein [Prescottella equi]NKR83055.1 hypothetical protein [Prescottella equi]ORL00319.1 hypothetical protein A6F56_05950 [Prescottella equi]ORL08627.1 hypothetical protein A6I84_07830 [Prescottella equi]ORL79466.1 hypothetical protein A5N75_01185 [Prescottella equi]